MEDGGNAAVLYILRRANERDPWSGQVGFPGGRQQESDHDDLATAVRECREEVGLHLDDAESYELLGRLPDRPITASGGRLRTAYLGKGRSTDAYSSCPLYVLAVEGDELALAGVWAFARSEACGFRHVLPASS